MVLLAISYFNTLAKINDFVATLAKLVNFTTLTHELREWRKLVTNLHTG